MRKITGMLLVLALAAAAQAAEAPRCEHPAPQMMRTQWQCLNGEWEFEFDPENKGEAENWFRREHLGGKIVVPFEIESAYSGVGEKNLPDHFWYLLKFRLESALQGPGRLLLHFEAVDYQARAWLNGGFLGEHTGGYEAFSFDITDKVRDGENILALRVFDSSDANQVRGKQSTRGKGYGIWYTPASGIWQPVWIEKVGESYFRGFKAHFDLAQSLVRMELDLANPRPGQAVSVAVIDPQGREVQTSLKNIPAQSVMSLVWNVQEPMLWSTEAPNLYRLKFYLWDEKGRAVDELESYLGLREIKVLEGKVMLNRRPLYQKMMLVQGYFQPGNYSPREDSEFRRDLELLKQMGFNGLRMHQKVEPQRYYYWADRLGVLIWQDMPAMASERKQFLPVPAKYREQFDREWQEVMEQLFNHPSIIAWVPFNESWGIWAELYSPSISKWALKVARDTKARDPDRLLIDNSGWLHRQTEILDIHHYVATAAESELIYRKLEKPWGTYSTFWAALGMTVQGAPVLPPLYQGVKYQGQPIVVSEYGGFGFYKTASKSLLDNYRDYTLAIGKYPYIQGYCYTQEYDIEQEQNGLLRPDRSAKIPIEEIKKINDQLGK
jgi:beta-galactosidase/beta-glucuronidase